MKKTSTMALVFISVPLVSAALTAGVRYAWDDWFGSPKLECPRSFDLGEQKRGVIAIGRFMIINSGKDILRLNDFRTSCSCAGVEEEIDGKLFRIKSLALSPGQEAQLFVRVSIGMRAGESQRVLVSFATNDPKNPRWDMEVQVPRVTGGCFPDPSAVAFGNLFPGQKESRLIDLYDNCTPGFKVDKVYSTRPERFTVTLLPLSEKDKQRRHPTAGKLFARIQVTPSTGRPGRLDGELHLTLSNETYPEKIPVIGEVVGVAECRPATLVLPRRVGNRSVRYGEVLILSRNEKPIEVAIEAVPPDIVAEVRNVPDYPNQRLLHIDWRPRDKTKQKTPSEERIRLHVRCDDQETVLEVPIILTENRS